MQQKVNDENGVIVGGKNDHEVKIQFTLLVGMIV